MRGGVRQQPQQHHALWLATAQHPFLLTMDAGQHTCPRTLQSKRMHCAWH